MQKLERSYKLLGENLKKYLTLKFFIAANALLNHQLARIRRHNRQRWHRESAAQETRRPDENEPLQYLDSERARPRAPLEHGSEFRRRHHRS